MQINISFDTLKKAGRVALVVTNLLAFAGAVHYYEFRRTADPLFQVMEFDLNSRKADIQKKYSELQAAAIAAQIKAADQNTPTSTVPPTTLAPKGK